MIRSKLKARQDSTAVAEKTSDGRISQDADQSKLDGIASGAQVNLVESITVDSVTQSVNRKKCPLTSRVSKSPVLSATSQISTSTAIFSSAVRKSATCTESKRQRTFNQRLYRRRKSPPRRTVDEFWRLSSRHGRTSQFNAC